MDRDMFVQIITSSWYIYVGVSEEELIKDYNYKKEFVEQGLKLCQALERK